MLDLPEGDRLSNNEMDPPNTLQLVMTNQCNLECSFCGGTYYMRGDDGEILEDTDRETQLANILDVIRKTPSLVQVNWTGGEPLLAYNKIKEWLDEVQSVNPNLKHYLMTNGLRIRKAMLPVLKRFDLITISLDGYKESERPLWKFIEEGRYEIFEVLAELNNWRTWAVLTRDRLGEKRWFEDIVELHNAMHHLGPITMNFMLDSKMPKHLSPDHCLNFTYGWTVITKNIMRLNKGVETPVYTNLERMFDSYGCNQCSEVVVAGADGKVFQRTNVPKLVEKGCSQLAGSGGPDAYAYLQKFMVAKRDAK